MGRLTGGASEERAPLITLASDEVLSSEEGESPTSQGGRNTSLLEAAVHAASLALAFIVLLLVSRRQWFAQDEWDFIGLRGLHDAPLSIWAPHNEHWSTTPILIYRGLLTSVGLKSYVPYLAVLFLAHIFLAHLLWRVMRKAGAAWLVSAAVLSTFLVHGAGAENLLWAFQIGFVGSVAMGVLAVHLADIAGREPRRGAAAVTSAVVALTFASISLPLVAVAGLVASVRRGWRAGVIQLGIPIAVYAGWLVLAGWHGLEATPFVARNFLLVPSFVWTGLTTTVERSTALSGAGAVVLLTLGYWLLRKVSRSGSGHLLVPSALVLGAVLMFALVAPGRVGFGVEQAQSSRYLYIAWALLIPALAVALTELASGSALRLGVVVALIAASLVHGVNLLLAEAERQGPYWRHVRAQILAAAVIGESGQLVFDDVQPEPSYSSQLDMGTLRRLAGEGRLPQERLGPQAFMAAAAHVQLRLAASPMLSLDAPPRPRVIRVLRAASTQAGEDCWLYRPTGVDARVVLDAATPAAIKLRAPGVDAIRLGLQAKDGSGSLPPVRERIAAFTPNTDVYLDIAAVDYLVSIGFPLETEICDVTVG